MDLLRYEERAELLKTLGHPVRLCIVHGLMHRACNVSGIQKCLKLPQSTVSQHLSVLKSRGIIRGKREGSTVTYSLISDEAHKVIRILLGEEAPFVEG